jgi:hypothetical protein
MEGNGKESSTDSLQAGRVLLQGHKPAPLSKPELWKRRELKKKLLSYKNGRQWEGE